jgi:hypothetical protein
VTVPAARAITNYTARVIPHCSGVTVPLEAAQILWQPRRYEAMDVSRKPLNKAKTMQRTAEA